MQQPKAKDPAAPGPNSEIIKAKLKAIYEDRFNIYMMLNKLKKDLHRKDNFPDEVILRFCDAYWKYKPGNKYTYFLHTFWMISADWHANNQIREHEEYKKMPVPDLIKDIIKGMQK